MRNRQAGFHITLIIVILVAVAVVGLIAWRIKVSGIFSNGIDAFADGYQGQCKNRDVSFTSPPLAIENLAYIRPLGSMLDGHVTPVDHVYVAPTNPNAADNTYPVLMPADGTVIEVSRMPDQYVGDRQGVELAPQDHRLVISFSCRYYAIYIHVHKLADNVAAQTTGLQPNENRQVNVELKAGDAVGYIGGSTFDWTPVDTQVTLKGFITPDLYKRESWKVHTVSPFDLYTGNLKSQLEAKSLRTVAPLGGKIDYDEPGKLIGTWFRDGSNGYAGAQQDRYWDGHLSVVPDYIDPTYTIVSIGNWDGSAKQFVVKGPANPAAVASGQMVTYELVALSYTSPNADHADGQPTKGMHPDTDGQIAGTIALEVQPGEKLKVEKFPGKSASQVAGFTPAAQMYSR